MEGPRGQNSYFKPRISTTPRVSARGATQPPDPTLPSRAHHKDYVSRTTSSNDYDDDDYDDDDDDDDNEDNDDNDNNDNVVKVVNVLRPLIL